jgi:hypothetical protein
MTKAELNEYRGQAAGLSVCGNGPDDPKEMVDIACGSLRRASQTIKALCDTIERLQRELAESKKK